MDQASIITIVVALASAMSGGIVSGLFNRRKSNAAAESTIAETATKAARELINEYKNQADYLQTQNDFLRLEVANLRQDMREAQVELATLSKTLENLNAQVLKYRLIISIFSMQFRSLGYEPLIHPDNIDAATVDELNDIASSLNSLQKRRDQKKGGGSE